MNRSSRLYISVVCVVAGSLLMISCRGGDVQKEDSELTFNQKKAIEYFEEIAFGFEFGGGPAIIRKWNQEIVIFVGGEQNETLQGELNDIIADLNELILLDSVEISMTSDSSASNYYIYFGAGEDYAKVVEDSEEYIEDNFGLFFIDWNSSTFTHGTMYVDTHRPALQNQRHLLREEFTQSFGLARDSDRYPESIFNSDYSVDVIEYSPLDKATIQLLYHPEIEFGMDEFEADSVLRRIVRDLIE